MPGTNPELWIYSGNMLRTLITKKNACLLVTVLAVLAALLTIWPARIYKEDHVFAGHGEIQRVSRPVDEENDAGEYFTAQYSHLETLGVYLTSYETGTSIKFQLFDTRDGVNTLKAEEHLEVDPAQLPGYFMIPVDVDLEPGETYVYLVRGENGSVFHVGLESEQVSADPSAPVYELGFYHDTSINGLATATKLIYRMPLDKKDSLVLGLLYLAAGAAAGLGFLLYYRLRPEKNRLTTLERVMQYCGTPLVFLYGGFFLVCIWQQRYDERLSDNLIYSIGVILTMLVLLFALWHDRTGLPDMINGEMARKKWRHYAVSICLMLVLACSTTYMNAVRDVVHAAMERWILILLCLMALFMGGGAREEGEEHRRRLPKPVWWLCIPVALLGVWMLIFRNGRQWVVLLAAVSVLLLVRYIFWRERSLWLQDLCRGIVLHFLFAVCDSLLHRYYFAFVYTRFGMQFHTVTVTGYYLLIVGAAALTLFSVRFRQVLAEGGNHSFWWYLDRLWKEALFVGICGVYMLMTMSRAGIFELAILYVLAALLTGWSVRHAAGQNAAAQSKKSVGDPLAGGTSSSGKTEASHERETVPSGKTEARLEAATAESEEECLHHGKKSGAWRMLAWTLLATVVLFPAVFSNQRLISTTVAEPHWYEEVEPYPDALVRHTSWNSKWFMSTEIFIRDFTDRVIGGGLGTKIYDHFDWGEHQNVYATSMDQYVTGRLSPGQQEKPSVLVVLAMNTESLAGAGKGLTSLDEGDYSNGRLGLWSIYLSQLNLTGHQNMGAALPGGGLALHAHNNVLQTAYDYGIPAGILFGLCQILGLAAAVLYFIRSADRMDRTYAMLALFIVLGYTVTGIVEWTFMLCNPFCIVNLLCLVPLLFR